jgi:hypothetical protein
VIFTSSGIRIARNVPFAANCTAARMDGLASNSKFT